jgi:hypothetical protein
VCTSKRDRCGIRVSSTFCVTLPVNQDANVTCESASATQIKGKLAPGLSRSGLPRPDGTARTPPLLPGLRQPLSNTGRAALGTAWLTLHQTPTGTLDIVCTSSTGGGPRLGVVVKG